jgi:hypothetical protein
MTGDQWVMLAVLAWVFVAAVAYGVLRGGTRKPWPCRHPEHPCHDCAVTR